MFLLGLKIATVLILTLWIILLIDYCKCKNKLSLYMLIFLPLTVFSSLLYTCIFNVTVPIAYEKYEMFFMGSWAVNFLYQLVSVMLIVKSGLLGTNRKKSILFAIFIVISTAIFYYFSAELRLLFYHIFVSKFN